ncbi:flavodoxin [Vallitalea longa]|uniref:Flavodoxin n=1 Tax=Vallitalea longa TaxID=2936439 RepID=A0A9W5YFH7_9FIRM|nr:flavodoxin domain-containing protein [Vallitalea longa]GKX32099.1 flavodoxin [Vallitalea longa]
MRNVTSDVLVAYASKHGSTEKIAQWIGKEIRGNVDVLNVNNVHNLNYDYIILGTPIYEHEPLPEMSNFITRNRNELENKNKSVFVVSSDNEEKSKREMNIEAFTDIIPGQINQTAVFAGEIDNSELSSNELQSVESYMNSISKLMGSYSKLNEKKCREYGKSLNRFI